tara:strand:- start:40 stop:795 length:756 start_codon:yes stop_codon:yes gene_type:complete
VKLFIPIIAYGGQVHAEFMMSMMRLQIELVRKRITAQYHPITAESLISRGRNSAAALFLQSDCDYMFFVDTDIAFAPNDFNEIAKVNKPLAIGAYCKKYIRKDKLVNYAKRNSEFEENWESYVTDFSTEIPPDIKLDTVGHCDNVINVNYGATGFMLIHKSVFKTIIKKRPDLKYENDIDFYSSAGDNFYDFFSVGVNPKTKKYESEDYGFCQLWKECGGEIYCATDTNLTHIGRHKYQGNLYNQIQFWNA